MIRSAAIFSSLASVSNCMFETKPVIAQHHKELSVATDRSLTPVEPTFAGQLRVLTYNFYLRPIFIKENQSDFKKERLNLFMDSELDNYDIIAFQEVFTTHWQQQIIRAARRRGFRYSALGPSATLFAWPPRFLDSGLLLISRYPIVDTKVMTYRNGASYDQLSSKGALFVRVAFSNHHMTPASSYVDIIVTHTQASYEDDSLENPTTKARLHQIVELNKWMKQIFKESSGKYPRLLLGDLNINSRFKAPVCKLEVPRDYVFRENLPDCVRVDGSSTVEYERAMKSLNSGFEWRDVLFEKYGFHPPTYGIGGQELVLTNRESNDKNLSLDYIFYESGKDGRWSIRHPKSQKLDTRTVSFSIPESQTFGDTKVNQGLSQLSDHFGVELIMRFKSQ